MLILVRVPDVKEPKLRYRISSNSTLLTTVKTFSAPCNEPTYGGFNMLNILMVYSVLCGKLATTASKTIHPTSGKIRQGWAVLVAPTVQ